MLHPLELLDTFQQTDILRLKAAVQSRRRPMAPNIDKEADHIKNKARRELLELLEGVRKHQYPCPISSTVLMSSPGSRKEEFGHRQGIDGAVESLRTIPHAQRIWRGQGIRARKWQYRLLTEEHRVSCAW